MSKEKKAEEEQARAESFCPFSLFCQAMEHQKGKHAPFFEHLKGAEAEILKAFKYAIDARLGDLEKKPAKKVTKIKVE